MFYRYEVKNNGIEDVLYLYLSMNYEFSKELSRDLDDTEIKRRTTNFIKNNGIEYAGEKVYLVIDGIIVKSFELNQEKEEVEVLRDELYYSNDFYMVTVQLEDSSIIEITLREYLLGVLATNMLPGLHKEVIKAMAILYRTYVFKEMSEYKAVAAINDFAIYKPISYYKISFAPNFKQIFESLEKAIDDTDCLFVSYENRYILPFIHISNNGTTLQDIRYPYLSSVSSLWDFSSPFFVETTNFSYEYLSKVLKNKISKDTPFEVVELSPAGKVLQLQIGNLVLDGKRLVDLLHLKSQFINIIVNKDSVSFITRGWGNFLGLSIFGANELAKNGCDYANILSYYFPKVKLRKYIKELS